MVPVVKPYHNLLSRVLIEGERREDRTGVGTISLFGTQTKYNLTNGFPLVTTKKVPFSSVVKELLWFLRGETNVKTLGCGIWDKWARPDGDLGPIYSAQWRGWKIGEYYQNYRGEDVYPERVDQISQVIHSIKTDPYSRRHIVSAWNVADIPDMALPPCHVMFQFYVSTQRSSAHIPAPDGARYLDLQLYQRSADLAVGVPFNIASYALLLSMVANECGLTPRYFIHTIGDAHIYKNHIAGIEEQLTREPKERPRLILPPGKSVLEIVESDIVLEGYDPHPGIKFEVAV